ncbi:unnamed protein product [Ilex paraguariensis]|uniref:Uncharacterized protein n=1 Tax=Ilex paraguariensis TaxID=185542 RepID=A0ABC8S3J1_9AQUA
MITTSSFAVARIYLCFGECHCGHRESNCGGPGKTIFRCLVAVKENLTPRKFGLKYVQKLANDLYAPYVVPDELGVLLNSMKRMLDVLRPKIESQLKAWGPNSEIICKQFVEKLAENTRLQSSTKLKKILQDSKMV